MAILEEQQVCIGVPVYHGRDFLAACLTSIAAQTHRNLRVMISIDGGDRGSEVVCEPFLTDARFELHRQPERLGWASNISWLMARNTGTFWYYHQQDDLVAPDYVETLLAEAIAHPGAAITFCDITASPCRKHPLLQILQNERRFTMAERDRSSSKKVLRDVTCELVGAKWAKANLPSLLQAPHRICSTVFGSAA